MSHPNKLRGSKWERDVVTYLQGRAADLGVADPDSIDRWGSVNGRLDRGDIRGVPLFTVECKDEEKIRLPFYIEQAKREQANYGTDFYAVVVKARRKSAAQAFVVMELDQFVPIVGALNGG